MITKRTNILLNNSVAPTLYRHSTLFFRQLEELLCSIKNQNEKFEGVLALLENNIKNNKGNMTTTEVNCLLQRCKLYESDHPDITTLKIKCAKAIIPGAKDCDNKEVDSLMRTFGL
ncbi:MAG: hypothetical protein A3C44_00355 [Gammaproteobacteria bacterium RIFCSPHIGHO2_02_FULL_39_13]|nr:MAG: hypothetical protein A3C44_00355 [Gammaproteobacteria bacterium RIFCSPHIGHO2_02_FULL_39_13]OGT48678.1 MAG: hypothetical protein A3E53_05325 [Gammaproteobacteria bacterium RIFCSPHIGHO2_12_FULL_39_24]